MANSDTPIIADKQPAKVNLRAGKKYFWCRCGRSSTQPYCDGSHKGTDMTPLMLSVDEDTEAFLCQCKASANTPYCDGSHARLGPAEPGDISLHPEAAASTTRA